MISSPRDVRAAENKCKRDENGCNRRLSKKGMKTGKKIFIKRTKKKPGQPTKKKDQRKSKRKSKRKNLQKKKAKKAEARSAKKSKKKNAKKAMGNKAKEAKKAVYRKEVPVQCFADMVAKTKKFNKAQTELRRANRIKR